MGHALYSRLPPLSVLATPIHVYNTAYIPIPIGMYAVFIICWLVTCCSQSRFTVRLAIAPSNPVNSMYRQRWLEVYLDADLSMTVHVTPTMRAWFAALRQIRSVSSSRIRYVSQGGSSVLHLQFFSMYPAMGVALYRRGVMDNLAR